MASRGRAWRPSLDDVARVSRGDAARVRGTGSRAVPHRLNGDERAHFTRAQEKGYLDLRRNAFHRRARRGAPLANTWRMWCDAQGRPAVAVAQGDGAAALEVDLSTMRAERYAEVAGARPGAAGVREVVRALDRVVAMEGTLEDGGADGEDARDGPTWRLPLLLLTYEFEGKAQARKAAREVAAFCVERLKGGRLAAKAKGAEGGRKAGGAKGGRKGRGRRERYDAGEEHEEDEYAHLIP